MYAVVSDLERKAEAALQSGDTVSAKRFARELLLRNTMQRQWDFGNKVHSGNQLLGLAALQDGDISAAKKYLILAGKTLGSPQLDTAGPRMLLAQALLDAGEYGVVLEYLELVRVFWATCSKSKKNAFFTWLENRIIRKNAMRLDAWKSSIEAGKSPRLNRIST